MEKLGALLRIYRDIEGYNIRDFAGEIGISVATMSRIENGKEMNAKNLAKVLKWLLED